MFGWGQKFAEAHLVSHLELAICKWLQEPGNPVMGHVPAPLLPLIIQELNTVAAAAEAKISAELQSVSSK
jgi:hypothetical protein